MLYLIDEPYGKNGMNLAQKDKNAVLVLIQNGVYIDTEGVRENIKIYAIRADVEKRGLSQKIGSRVELIDYDKLVDLIVENKIANFA
jgi:sulfur relay protein TusB/DsrH